MKLVEEIKYLVDIDKLKQQKSLAYSNHLFKRMSGISIQHRKNILPPWDSIDGLESLKIYENCTEQDFNIIHENFKNTELGRIIKDFNLVRSRLMLLKGKTNYTIHKDISCRLHIPIDTNPDCLFYFPDHNEHFYLEEGKVYKVNTTEKHTMINGGTDRVHLIGCLYD